MIYRLPTFLLLALLAQMLFSCGSEKELTGNETTEGLKIIPFTTVGQGALFGGGQEGFNELEPTLIALRSAEEWAAFKAQMNSVNTVTGGFRDQEIDFESEMLVACIDKVRGSGGHEVRIDAIEESAADIQVRVLQVSPVDMAASVLTQPFHIVRIPKTDKNLKLLFP